MVAAGQASIFQCSAEVKEEGKNWGAGASRCDRGDADEMAAQVLLQCGIEGRANGRVGAGVVLGKAL